MPSAMRCIRSPAWSSPSAIALVKTLSEKEREALVLRDIQGLPTKTVARILGSSEATIRSQVSTARVKIKRFAEHFLGRKS